MPTQPAARSDRNLGWSLAMVLRSWQEHAEHVLTDLPQGSRGHQLLSAVVSEDAPTQGALAARLAIDRTVLTYLIDDLEAAGLLQRQLDPRDRRARRIVPTDKGRDVLASADRRIAVVEAAVLAGLSDADRELFRELATRAAETIRTAAPGTDPCLAVESVLAD